MMDKTSLRRIGCLSVLFLAISLFLFNKQLHFLSNEKVSSFDGRIELSWESIPSKRYDGIRVCISDKNGSLLQETELAPEEHSVTFADGKHGELYHFILQLVRNGKVIEKSKTLSAIFYRSSDVKKVPLIVFDTDSGSDPQFEVVRPRSGYSGLGIKGNKFESGSFQLVCSDSRTECHARIKVRGNTSAVSGFGGGKVPYKISFSEPVSLLSSCPEVRSSEWVLLKCNNINTYYGYLIAKRCQSVWTPQFGFVDMVVNGDWKGSYLLIQDPKEGTVSAGLAAGDF